MKKDINTWSSFGEQKRLVESFRSYLDEEEELDEGMLDKITSKLRGGATEEEWDDIASGRDQKSQAIDKFLTG